MRILITNDDGINAAGLDVLYKIAHEVAGAEGEVWTVAPAFEQSGVGHCISYTHPTMIAKLGERRYAAEGSPADCVLAGIYDVMTDGKPDLILSGVNRGNNSGENTLYSGTVGGAMEAALQGLPAIALSQFYGPGNVELEDEYEAATVHGAALVRDLLQKGDWGDKGGYCTFYSVNFPPLPAAEVKGRAVTAQGFRPGTRFSVKPTRAPNGRRFLWVEGAKQDVATGPGTDVQANIDGYISITPMRADLTAHDQLAGLKAVLE
ncbi:5'/3'-nucleotidase SurE [Aliiruegeria lutimaris]|uniref:5'-nucleotidase SurE n=1 Tax=Aliiruegeria lutimaris TaxID=571298 RepID=A0A1G8LEH0_9RHOB|nr:5'/3'-nucleotidase SurE [Aliiruegeria lutimaris]SDI53630.1 5'-nucleotidase /3'-nucleotidase /exopolyphosphatase [Aliiruegeria lutimaris]